MSNNNQEIITMFEETVVAENAVYNSKFNALNSASLFLGAAALIAAPAIIIGAGVGATATAALACGTTGIGSHIGIFFLAGVGAEVGAVAGLAIGETAYLAGTIYGYASDYLGNTSDDFSM